MDMSIFWKEMFKSGLKILMILWYTMNRSGLFENDDEENKSDINNWTPIETRHYITEIRL